MFSLNFTTRGVPPSELDVPAVERAMTDAALPLMRRRGLPRGQNLTGVFAAAKEAAEREVQRQLEEGATE